MAQLPTAIDCTREVEPITREPLPAGEYVAQVIDDQMKTTKAGNGQYLELKGVQYIPDGENQGLRISKAIPKVNAEIRPRLPAKSSNK